MILFNELKEIKAHYDSPQPIVDGLEKHIQEIIADAEFATNSVYRNGNIDEIGRYLPYYNAINFRLNVAVRSTDVDLKDIDIVSDSPKDVVKTKVLRKEFYNWAKQNRFSQFLNKLGRTRAKYGGVIVKKSYDEEGDIITEVVDWRNVIVNQKDILGGAIIERHFLTPVELSEKMGIWNDVREAMEKLKKDEDNNEIQAEVWEVHGHFTTSAYLESTDEDYSDDDNFTYSLQRHFVFVIDEKPQWIFYSEQVDEIPYKYLSYEEREGFGLGIGIVESSLESQRVINNYVISQYNAVELAGKTVMVSDSDSLNKSNAFSNILNGEVLRINRGESISSLNLSPSAFPAFSGLIEQWDRQAERATSTYEAVTGETMPSGTPFRSLAIQNQEGNSTFTYRIEEVGLFLEEIINDWILPDLVTKLNREHILAGEYSMEELNQIDNAIATDKANKEVIEDILNGKDIYAEDFEAKIQALVQANRQYGQKRFLDIPKNYFKGFEGYATILITNEKKNKQQILDSLSNILLQVAQAPQILQDPTLFKIFSQIIELSGADISPLDLQQQPKLPQAPTQEAPQEVAEQPEQ